MAAAGAQQPGSAGVRYLEVAGALGRKADEQEDLWLLVLDEWGLTIDAWEGLPWWQQDAYLRALNRRNDARRAENERQGKQQSGGKGRVAGRRPSRAQQRAGKARPPASPASPAGSGTKLKESGLWGGRKAAPPGGVGRVTSRGPRGAPPTSPPA